MAAGSPGQHLLLAVDDRKVRLKLHVDQIWRRHEPSEAKVRSRRRMALGWPA